MAKTKKRFGDRRDGTRIRDLDGVHYIMPYLMPNRCDCEVYIVHKMDVTKLMQYLAQLNGPDAPYKTTPFHAFVTAIAKIIYHRPLLNRFISFKHYYQRNFITLSFVAKRRFEDHSEEALMIVKADENTTMTDISKRIVGDVQKIRDGSSNDIGDTLDFLKKMPRGVMRFIMMMFRFLDRHDGMPKFITHSDTNYTTALISNLGSIKCGAVHHHLNNYGTNSILITIGEIHKEPVYDKDGNAEIRDLVEFGVTLDERIADGFYFARSLKLIQKILDDPESLLRPIKEDIADE